MNAAVECLTCSTRDTAGDEELEDGEWTCPECGGSLGVRTHDGAGAP